MKQVVQLDPNGYYIGVTTADESPLEHGKYLLPKGAIDAPEPSVPDGKCAKWIGEWVFEDIWYQEEEEPFPTPVSPQSKKLTSLEFIDVFTKQEQLAIATSAMQSVYVKLWYDRTLAARFITLADPQTEVGLTALVDAGLLTEERKSEIIEAMQ